MKNCTPLWREAHFQVKMYKTHQRGPLLEVEMSKKCTLLWREAHVKSKCTRNHMYAPLLEVQMSFRVAGARDCAPGPKWEKREGFVAFPTTTTTTPHYTPIHFATATAKPSLHSTTLHSATLHCIQLHSITLHFTTLHYTTFH